MIYRINVTYDEGRESSIKAIIEELKLMRNTVRKCL